MVLEAISSLNIPFQYRLGHRLIANQLNVRISSIAIPLILALLNAPFLEASTEINGKHDKENDFFVIKYIAGMVFAFALVAILDSAMIGARNR